jgi:hypothetical protein
MIQFFNTTLLLTCSTIESHSTISLITNFFLSAYNEGKWANMPFSTLVVWIWSSATLHTYHCFRSVIVIMFSLSNISLSVKWHAIWLNSLSCFISLFISLSFSFLSWVNYITWWAFWWKDKLHKKLFPHIKLGLLHQIMLTSLQRNEMELVDKAE